MAKVLPTPADLVGYNHAVAGHDGILCDADGELFIKPCTSTEVAFYETSRALHHEFVGFIPRFLGVLSLDEKLPTETVEDVEAKLLTTNAEQGTSNSETFKSSKTQVTGKRIATNQAVVLENASYGFCRPNILDVKLGVRLWADDAPEQKRIRFDKITAESTHKDLGFRIAGMRIWQGHDAKGEGIDEEGYRIYDKNYGRVFVNKENVHESFKKFIFNEGAGIDEELGKLIIQAFLTEVTGIQLALENHENRMYSASLLFVFEGDGKALRTAMELSSRPPQASDDSEEDEYTNPKVYSVKLIDFAHAEWTPGHGPDENTLLGALGKLYLLFVDSRTPDFHETKKRQSSLNNSIHTPNPVIHDVLANSEWRFEVAVGQSIQVLSGTAEIFGTELALNHTYKFQGTKSSVFTWHGCQIEVKGDCEEYTAEETPMVQYANTHFALERLREVASQNRSEGPRVLIVGPTNAGKTSLVKILTAYALRMGRRPMVINTDPREGLLSIPGTLTATAFATIIDVEHGWGSSPTSTSSPVPVKLPLCYFYGLGNPEDSTKLYEPVLTRLALAAISRMVDDESIRQSGMIIDTPGVISQGKGGYDLISHIVSEFSVNIILALGSERLHSEMHRRFSAYKSSSGEPMTLVKLDKSGGCVDRDEQYLQHTREASIKEYFFGGLNSTLSPHTQQINFDEVIIYKIKEECSTSFMPGGEDVVAEEVFEKIEPSILMLQCTLAVMYATETHSQETVRDASVMGFVYVSEVDEKKRKLKVLAPMNTRITDRPLLWGSWPEPTISVIC